MPKHFLDRGQPISGIERTARDSRVPHNIPRSMTNFALPDKRLARRAGFTPHGPIVARSMLAKQTGTVLSNKAQEDQRFKNDIYVSPLSYALLRWHDDYQPKVSRDWTVEFGLKLGEKESLILNPFKRQCKGSAPIAYDFQCRKEGVIVYDQMILSNALKVNLGTTGTPGTDLAYDQNDFDVFPTTAMTIGLNETEIWYEYSLVKTDDVSPAGSQGRYYLRAATLTCAFSATDAGEYKVGEHHHIAVTYSTSTRTLRFYVDGVQRDTTTVPANHAFVGEYDQMNGETTGQAFGRQRDIVLLNEATVRGGYSSSCNITNTRHHNQIFYHAYDAAGADADDPAMPWCLSPPKGTAMRDLRIWHQELSAPEILADMFKRESTLSFANLKGGWSLDDGAAICQNFNQITGKPLRDITVHHTYPGYVARGLNDLALVLSDGDHAIWRMGKDDEDYVQDIAKMMQRTFGYDGRGEDAGDLQYRQQGTHDFTVQITIRTPYTFQQEINIDPAAPTQTELLDTAGTATRNASIHTTAIETDGSVPPSGVGRLMTGADNPAGADAHTRRAYDMTLFSIEGTAEDDGESNDGEIERKPIVRGLIDPTGKVILECYKEQHTGTPVLRPLLYRLRSTTTLSTNTVYVINFVQRVQHTIDGSRVVGDHFAIEIWIREQTAGVSATPDSTRAFIGWDANGKFMTSSYRHSPAYDVIIGASSVNSGWDKYISTPGVQAKPDKGPWRVTQHFMSPLEDQPGFFECSCFRLWSHALDVGEIERTHYTNISRSDYVANLLINLEFQEIAGTFVKNKTRYPLFFELGYKSWGHPEGYRDDRQYSTAGSLRHQKAELIAGAWSFEDCLGYSTLLATAILGGVGTAYENKVLEVPLAGTGDRYPAATVNLLAPFQSTLTQQYGLLAAYDGALMFDDSVGGVFQDIYIKSGGMLTEFAPGEKWWHTVIGDRTFLTSRGGITKVFNGRNITVAGFRRWTGGVPLIESAPTTGFGGATGALVAGKYYGVRVVYFDEQDSILHISPVAVLKMQAGRSAIRISNIPSHYDPRVTSIRFYRTLAQENSELAGHTPLFPTSQGVQSNLFISVYILGDSDGDMFPAPLDLFRTVFPQCEHSASYNGRLWLAGDQLVPDAVFYSDAGNPESIDTIDRRLVIEEGSGDRISRLIAAFGSLFVFKINSLWRINDIGGSRFQLDRIASVGAVSSRSVILLTMPDSGRQVIFFWSQHGPYLYDGSTLQYVGGPIEEQDVTGESHAEYAWLNPRTTITLHDVRRRELLVLYEPTSGQNRLGKGDHSHAIVFNYRFRAWYRYKGMQGNVTLSQSFSGGQYSGFGLPLAGSLDESEKSVYHAFLGGTGGSIFTWAEGLIDGAQSSESIQTDNPYTVKAFNSGLDPNFLTLTTGGGGSQILDRAHTDQYLTIHRESNDTFFTVKIVTNDRDGSGDPRFYIRNTDVDDVSYFSPAAGDKVYICQPVAEIEFPWDTLAESPGGIFEKKNVHELVTWHDEDWLFRYSRDYDPATVSAYQALSDSNSQIKRTAIKKGKVESIKLELVSFALEAKLDAYGYQLRSPRDA